MAKQEVFEPFVEPSKPSRPYTDYNIFFQLEREYVLQVILGVKPTLNASEVFNPSDECYSGPPLPSRYKKLVLPNDWYVPGKIRRRKRRHRKSHGKISFHDLSQKIAKTWSNVDKETLSFCEKLSDIGVLHYKESMRNFKRAILIRKTILFRKNLNPNDHANHIHASFHAPDEMRLKEKLNLQDDKTTNSDTILGDCNQHYQPTDPVRTGSPFLGNSAVNESCHDEVLDAETSKYLALFHSANFGRQWADHCVDMEDDEIRFMWESISD